MKKLLATGLIASVAMASAESSASCGNGGFYVGANFGLAFSKAKATNEKKDDYQPGDHYGAKESGWTICANNAMVQNAKCLDVMAATARSAVAVDAVKNSRKKTKFLAELVLGYDFRLNDAMIGVELEVGGIFGSHDLKRKEQQLSHNQSVDIVSISGNAPQGTTTTIKADVYAKVKQQWHIAFMPRVGYLFTPQFEGYVTFGVKLAKFKTEVNDLPFVTEQVFAGVNQLNASQTITKMSKKSTKVMFIAGAGVRYEIDPSLFAKLEYNFEFGAKPKLHSEAMPELKKIKVTSHTIKLGLGYRF